MQSKLEQFCESILNINASAISAFGGGLPGMLGKSAAEQGSITPAADTIYELKRSIIDFSRALKAKDTKSVKQGVDKIEGLILNLQVMSVLDSRQTEQLIDQLHELAAHG